MRASRHSQLHKDTFRYRVRLPDFFADETEVEPDRERVSFHMVLEVEQADVQLILEDKSTLGFMHATALKVIVAHLCLHPCSSQDLCCSAPGVRFTRIVSSGC